MRRRKRRGSEQAPPAPPAVRPGVYRPFREMKDKLPVPAKQPKTAPAGRADSASPGGGREGAGGKPGGGASEGRAFESAMSGVTLLDRQEPPAKEPVPPPPPEDEFAIADRFLSAFVEGEVPFDFSDTEEYIQGAVRGLDPRLVHRLRSGNFAVEGHLDLHGLDRHEAKQALRDFIEQSRRAGKRCLLVVHGRGLGSKDGVPVLRERMKEWLSRGGIGRQVLAFTSARPPDGGTGAVYVLVRR